MRKRITAILLAALMTVSLLGGITVSAAAVEKEYYFSVKGDDGKGYIVPQGIDKNEVTADGKAVWNTEVSTAAGQHTLFMSSAAEFGSHGWKYFDVDEKAFEAKNVYVAQVVSNCIKFYTDYASKNLTLEDGSKVAIALEAPGTAGFYKLSTCINLANVDVYAGKRTVEKTTVEDYMNDGNHMGLSTANGKIFKSGVTSLTFDEVDRLLYSDGSTDIIFALKHDPKENSQLKGAKLTQVTGNPTFSISAQRLDTDETTDKLGNKATISVKLGDYNVANGFVDFSVPEEDKGIISVDENGVVTALSAGTATVTATVGSYSKSFDIVVEDGINEIYYFGGNFVELNAAGYKNNPDIWDTTATNASVMQIKGFGNHGYKRIGYTYTRSDDLTTVSAHPYQNTSFAIRSYTTRSGSYTFDSLNCAIALEAPKKGFYTITISANKADIPVYAAPYAEEKTVDNYIVEPASLGKTYKGTGASSVATASNDVVCKALKPTSNIAVYSDGVTPIAFAYALAKGESVDVYAVKLAKNNNEVTYTVPDTIEEGRGAVVNIKVGAAKLTDSFTTFASSNPDVISIDANGTMKALKPGKSTITAKIGDNPAFTKEITVPGEEEPEVPVDTPEYVAAFTPDETTVSPVTNSVAALAIAKDGSALEVTKSVVKNANGTYSVKADAESGDYKFLYWAKGLENGGKKRIVSFDASFTYAPHNGANYLIAVYGKSGDEASKSEYYNANGQLLENGETLPSMAGYGTAKGWVDCGDGIFVAEYNEAPTESFNITVNGKTEKYAYGDKVTCTADAKNGDKVFFGWRKTINGKAELVSINTEYSFNAWEDCTVEAVYADEAGVFSGLARKIVLGTFNVGGKSAIMAEFIGFTNVAEKGISLGNSDIAMSTNGNQFTIINDIDATDIGGYAILNDGTKVIFKK